MRATAGERTPSESTPRSLGRRRPAGDTVATNGGDRRMNRGERRLNRRFDRWCAGRRAGPAVAMNRSGRKIPALDPKNELRRRVQFVCGMSRHLYGKSPGWSAPEAGPSGRPCQYAFLLRWPPVVVRGPLFRPQSEEALPPPALRLPRGSPHVGHVRPSGGAERLSRGKAVGPRGSGVDTSPQCHTPCARKRRTSLLPSP